MPRLCFNGGEGLRGACLRAPAAWSTGFLTVPFVGALLGRDAVIALEPPAEIDLRAARRAEWPVLRRRRLAADRARAQCGSLDRGDGGHCRADIIKAPRFENVRGDSRGRPRSRCCGRIAARLAAWRRSRPQPA